MPSTATFATGLLTGVVGEAALASATGLLAAPFDLGISAMTWAVQSDDHGKVMMIVYIYNMCIYIYT